MEQQVLTFDKETLMEKDPLQSANTKQPPNVNTKVFVEPCQIEFFYEKFKQSYPMYKNPRGQCLILNIYQINGMPPRRWSDRDTDALKQLFEQLLFTVRIYTDTTHDLCVDNFKKILKDFSELEEHEIAQCSVICLMSHGEEGYLTTKEGDKVLLDDIFSMFNNVNCPNLAGKPKLFFIQSCRDDPINGPAEDLGIRLTFNPSPTNDSKKLDETIKQTDSDLNDGGTILKSTYSSASCSDNNTNCNLNTEISLYETGASNKALPTSSSQVFYHIPSLCDMIIGYPTQKGFIAYRKPEIGSWYMNAIVQVFSKHAHDTDLCAMLNMVNSLISNEVTNTGKKQMSEFTSKLTKPYFYFFPGLANDDDDVNCQNELINEQVNVEQSDDLDKDNVTKLDCLNSTNTNKKLKTTVNEQTDSNYFYHMHKVEQTISDEHVEFLADKAQCYWKHIAREISLTELQIIDIDKNFNAKNKKLRHVLNLWINDSKTKRLKNENDVSFKRLVNILVSCRLNRIKDEFLESFSRNIC